MPIPQISHLDRRVKIWLLITSLGALAALTAAALREEFGSEWRRYQRQYTGILATKAVDEQGRSLLGAHEIKLRQIVVPELGVTDRCVSCHLGIDDPRMTDVPNPFRVHPGEYVQMHPVERFGCTICHRGQGAAVVFAEAKAEGFHWDYPLLPRELTQSSCALCHTPNEVEGVGGERLALGARLFELKGCYSCHKLAGRGGNMGLALDREGLKVKGQLPMTYVDGPHTVPQWLIEHFADPQRIVAGSLMRNPGLSYDETLALTTYMLSLQERDLPRSFISPALNASLAERAEPSNLTGEQLYNRYCSNCHDLGTFGRFDKTYNKFMPAIRGASFLAVADSAFLAANIRNGRPGTLMPGWGIGAGGLSETEIGRVISFLKSAPPGRLVPATELPASLDLSRGNAQRGSRDYARLCVGCHGPGGIGNYAPALANTVFQSTADAAFIYRTISYGRIDAAMPAFRRPGKGGLTDAQIEDLVAYVQSLGHRTGSGIAATAGNATGQKP